MVCGRWIFLEVGGWLKSGCGESKGRGFERGLKDENVVGVREDGFLKFKRNLKD